MIKPYYESDGITIYNGDCRDVIPHLGQVDHVITDPPYSEVTHEGARTSIDKKLVDFASVTAEELRDIFSSIAQTRWVVAFMDWRHVAAFEANPPKGLAFIRFGIWHKPNGAPQFTGDRPGTGWEAIAIMHRDGQKLRWNGGGHHAVYSYNKVNGQHPTAKPERLVGQLVEQFTEPGEMVLDPFMGSGTTLVAAKMLGRRAIGIEREERYCAVAKARLAQGSLFTAGTSIAAPQSMSLPGMEPAKSAREPGLSA